jgi:LPS-assembly protein
MSYRCKVSVKTIFSGLSISLLILLTLQISASHKNPPIFLSSLTHFTDTTPVPNGVLSPANAITSLDTSRRSSDSSKPKVFIDSIKISKDSLDGPISYSASDSGVLIIPKKQFYLYGKAHTEYNDLQLDAGVIRYDQNTQIVMAYGARDTGNNPLDKPTLVQGGATSISDTIIYNLRTKKGLTKNTYYNEGGEIYVNTQIAKTIREDGDNVVYAYRNTFTTCNLDTPHFAFRTKKMKLIANKLAVSGPAHPEFEGVPIPIYIPFGLYPMKRGRHSGILAPQFSSNEQFGLGIEGLGYYKVLSDYTDVTLRTNLYSYGGWNVVVTPKYYKRYRYNGSFNLSMQHTKSLNNFPGAKEEFTTNNSFMVNWYHSRDSKARPGTNFSASVNAGSTKFNQYVPNNNLVNFQNQLTSTIQWSKTTSKTNLTIAANHDQNNVTRLVNMRLPNVTYSVLTFYPFQKKERAGTEKWYEKLGLSYDGSLTNQLSFFDSAINARRLLDTLQWGISHRIPVSLALPSLGPVTLSPSINYEERWLGRSVTYKWNDTNKRIDSFYAKSFYTVRDVSVGISANTRIFGTFQFGKKAKVQAIRHEIRPSVGFAYKPDLAKQYWDSVQVDENGRKIPYSKFQANLFQAFSLGKFGGITFGVDNLLEMKVRDKHAQGEDSLKPATKKVRLIDGFGFNGGYNLAVDSFQWSNISFYLRSTLFEKISITANANLDPYKSNQLGDRTKQLAWTADKPGIGTVTSGGVAISASFQSKKAEEHKNDPLPHDQFVSPDEQQRMIEYVRSNPAEFTDFNIPWSVQTSFSYNFYRSFNTTTARWVTQSTANIYLNGDFSLSPKWKIGGNTYFDFTSKKIQTLSMFITRDMHCWQLAINITPVGLYRSFAITLNPKSGLLRDLRINRSRYFSGQ